MGTQQIITDISNYIANNGGQYRDWYIGITLDARQRLFNDHRVYENGSGWIFREADTNPEARSIEKYFLDHGCDGGTGGGDNTSRMVYSYKKSGHTNP